MGCQADREPPGSNGGGLDPVARPLDRRRVVALVPTHREPPRHELLERIARFVGGTLLVDDGSPEASARAVARLAADLSADLLRLPRNAGKGSAVAAGLRRLLAQPAAPEAVIVLDGDGQHPPEGIPSFLVAAETAHLVVGDRFHDLRSMPLQRRLTNRATSFLLSLAAGAPVRDSQCGMRLLRGRALHDVPFPEGRYEAETVHLKRRLRAGVPVAWVPIPALYRDERSSFRALRDGARVLRAALR